MNYIIFDLEFNQNFNSKTNDKALPFEIIQIGAIKINEELERIKSFDSLVKPLIYPDLHPYILELTRISQDEISTSKDFKDVFNSFLNFLDGEDYTFVIWGTNDIKELIRNMKYHSIDTSLISKKYIDLQEVAGKYFKAKRGTKIGLKAAIEHFMIHNDSNFHNAYYDALYTFKVFKKLYNEDINIKTYKENPKRVSPKNKAIVDTEALFLQFEKMYYRKITEEEKTMIKLAYTMGKTNQFIKKELPK